MSSNFPRTVVTVITAVLIAAITAIAFMVPVSAQRQPVEIPDEIESVEPNEPIEPVRPIDAGLPTDAAEDSARTDQPSEPPADDPVVEDTAVEDTAVEDTAVDDTGADGLEPDDTGVDPDPIDAGIPAVLLIEMRAGDASVAGGEVEVRRDSGDWNFDQVVGLATSLDALILRPGRYLVVGVEAPVDYRFDGFEASVITLEPGQTSVFVPVESTLTSEDPVTGDPVEGDPVTGDPAEGDPVEGDPVEGDPVEGDPVESDIVEPDVSVDDPPSSDDVVPVEVVDGTVETTDDRASVDDFVAPDEPIRGSVEP